LHGQKPERDLPVEKPVDFNPIQGREIDTHASQIWIRADQHIEVLILVGVEDAVLDDAIGGRCLADADRNVLGRTGTTAVGGVLGGDVDGIGDAEKESEGEDGELHCWKLDVERWIEIYRVGFCC